MQREPALPQVGASGSGSDKRVGLIRRHVMKIRMLHRFTHALALYLQILLFFKVILWPIGLYRHPPTKTGRSRPYPNQFSSGLEGGQFMKPFIG